MPGTPARHKGEMMATIETGDHVVHVVHLIEEVRHGQH